MVLENKLNIKNSAQLADSEERISKAKALGLFNSGLLDSYSTGTFETLAKIHKHLFDEIYDFAGKLRTVNISKGNFRFCSVVYLKEALEKIDKMPQKNFDEIIDKYVEMNVIHPFREGNGRSMRLWLDLILKKELNKVIDWAKINKEDYLLAMERSPVKSLELKELLKKALTDDINNRTIYIKGLDASYGIEGYYNYKAQDL